MVADVRIIEPLMLPQSQSPPQMEHGPHFTKAGSERGPADRTPGTRPLVLNHANRAFPAGNIWMTADQRPQTFDHLTRYSSMPFLRRDLVAGNLSVTRIKERDKPFS